MYTYKLLSDGEIKIILHRIISVVYLAEFPTGTLD